MEIHEMMEKIREIRMTEEMKQRIINNLKNTVCHNAEDDNKRKGDIDKREGSQH